MNKTSLTALLSITILTSVIAISEIPTAFAAPVLNPDNGHYYQYVSSTHITWTDAKTAAENSVYKKVNGHLVTITSQSENDFVAGLVPDNSHTWIGLTDKVTEGTYEWVTGESFSYTNWDANQPDGSGSNEDYVEFFESNERWSDNIDTYGSITGYVIEYSD